MDRKDCLNNAMECVCGIRQKEYGDPGDNFRLISALWSAYLNYNIRPSDVANMMALMKIARIRTGKNPGDSYVDLAGYAAIGAELAPDELRPEISQMPY